MSGPWERYAPQDGPWSKYGAPPPMSTATPSPSTSDLILNATAKGAAGIPDSIINAPTNLLNIGKSLYGAGAYALGRPDIGNAVEMSEPPNLAHKGLSAVGAIRPEAEPQTGPQRMLDTAIQGGVGMIAAPAKSGVDLVKNAVLGLLGGGAAQGVKEWTKGELGEGWSDALAIGTGAAIPATTRMLRPSPAELNPVKAATLKEGQAAGYVTEPAEVKPSFINNRLESIAGKAAVKQEATLRNQANTTAITPEDIGLPTGTPLTEQTMKGVRQATNAPYDKVAALSPVAKSALEKLEEARFEASEQWAFHARTGDPAVRKVASALEQKKAIYERVIEKEATKYGAPELVQELREARTIKAKTHDIERALNIGSGDVSAPVLGRAIDKAGVNAKSGNIAVTGRYQQAFPRVMGEGEKTPPPGVSGTDAAMAAMLAMTGYNAGGWKGALVGGLPLVRGAARSAVLSPAYQRMLATEGKPLSDAAAKSAFLARAIAERNEGGRQ